MQSCLRGFDVIRRLISKVEVLHVPIPCRRQPASNVMCTLGTRLALLREQDVPQPEGFAALISGFFDRQVRMAS